jgi:hypothetical protein
MKSRRLQHRADGVRDRVGRYFSVRAHQLERRFDLPPSLGLFVISFFFERSSFFGSYDDGFITARFQQMLGVLFG